MRNKNLAYAIYLVKSGVFSIDDEGRIWRHFVMPGGRMVPVEKRRAEHVNSDGYFRIALYVEGKIRSVMAHQIVWEWTNGPIPEGLQINHKDLNKQNNRLENLEIVDRSGNISHSYANGRSLPWSRSTKWQGKDMLTSLDIEQIKLMRLQGEKFKTIAKKFNRSIAHIHRVCGPKIRRLKNNKQGHL
jgi:hypothetical protein